MFFGAVLSAIMSTASGTLLAPSVTFAENVARGFLPEMEDHKFLRSGRLCVLGFSGIVLAIALNSELSIFETVENAYKITLVGAIVPLFAGLFWKRANEGAALLSISLWALVSGFFVKSSPPKVRPPAHHSCRLCRSYPWHGHGWVFV